ncbi:hypothetical protein ACU6TU_13200 [Halomonas sp. LS-001]
MFTIKKILLFLFLSFLSVPAVAEPSKAETFSFLKEKLTFSYKYGYGSYSEKSLSASEDFCTITASSEVFPHDYGIHSQYLWQETIKLKEVDPTEIREVYRSHNNSDNVYIMIREGRELINVKITYSRFALQRAPDEFKNKEFNKSETELKTIGERDAEKVARAFTHLVSLCGGTGELF